MEPQPEEVPLKSELESFRREWLSEVRAKHPTADAGLAGPSQPSIQPATIAPKSPKVAGRKPTLRHLEDDYDYDYDYDYVQPRAFEDDGQSAGVLGAVPHLDSTGKGKGRAKEPVSALEHYEAAVEKESQGSLGDSLQLYRKAFRIDSHVDKKYREKYFPKTTSKAYKPNPSNASPTVPGTAHHSSAAGGAEAQTTSDLIASFAGLAVTRAPPPVESMPEPPCPIADIPGEVLSHIFQDVAVADVRDFVRLAQVCKRFAYVVATDSAIWRRLCLGSEFGFPGMHHEFTHTFAWDSVQEDDENMFEFNHEKGTLINKALRKERQEARRREVTQALLEKSYAGSWKNMFRNRPRIRFGGTYISTVNYWRTGQGVPNQVTWGSPMHVVTYYRYLRFFRDGTLMSLPTTHAPAEVVPHFTRENLAIHAGGGAPHLASSVIAGTYRGIWKTGCSWNQDSSDSEDRAEGDRVAETEEAEAHIFIETEGVGKYTFEIELAMRSAGRAKGLGAKNNKLVWRSFASYCRLKDDRQELALKNDKPFFFSRVASYGIGE